MGFRADASVAPLAWIIRYLYSQRSKFKASIKSAPKQKGGKQTDGINRDEWKPFCCYHVSSLSPRFILSLLALNLSLTAKDVGPQPSM